MGTLVCVLLAFGSWGILAAETAWRRYRVNFRQGWYAPALTIIVLWLITFFRLAFSVRSLSDRLLIDGIGLPLLTVCTYALLQTCLLEARRSA